MFEDVVVGVRDDDDGPDAIALAKALVSPRGELTLVHVYVVRDKPAADSGAFGEAAKRRDAMQRLTALSVEFGVDAEVSWVPARSVRHGLHEFVASRRADLLVVRATHNDDLARDSVGDDTRRVLEDAPCAVAVAPAGYAARTAGMTTIGVAYDGSPESERALALARSLAAERRTKLSAFEVVEPPVYVRDPWNFDGEVNQRVEEARQRVAAVGGVQADAGYGEAVDELLRYERTVDLLVLGSHHYRPMDRLLEECTSQQLADEGSSPLLVLPFARVRE